MLLKKKRREKTLNIIIKIELIVTIRYSNKRILSGKTILNYDV